MGNKLYKFTIEAPSVADQTKSREIKLDASKGKAFRISKLWVSWVLLDALATGDKQGIQFATVERNGETSLLNIDDKDEIFTWQQAWNVLGTNGPTVNYQDPNKCVEIPGVDGIMLEVDNRNYMISLATGQDGADVVTYVKILGTYVGKTKNVDVNNFNNQSF